MKPMYYEILSPTDQQSYDKLRESLSSLDNKFIKNQRCQTIQSAFNSIREYCCRHDDEDWKRYLVCGICWLDNDIAINIRNIRLLLNKCKSSINGALVKMGYGADLKKSEESMALISKIPFLKGNFIEQRKWTIRRRVIASPAPLSRFNPYASPYLVTPQPFFAQYQLCQYNSQIEKANLFAIPQMQNVQQNIQTNPQLPEQIQCPCKQPEVKEQEESQVQRMIKLLDENFEMDPACCMPIEWNVELDDQMLEWS